MSDLSSIERLKFEALFDMETGYVLDFSNNTFSAFTLENIGLDIFDEKYDYRSGSKANRLRKFWQEETNDVVGKLLLALLEYWLAKKQINGDEISSRDQTLYDECQKIANRLKQGSTEKIQEFHSSAPASNKKGRIFISYRRADSAGYAGRIYDRLVAHFGEDAIFMDVDTIEGGVDFVKVLEDAVQSCDVLIALIGRQWLNIKDKGGKRRLDNPEDFVRIEIATALKRNIRVIPVLVDGIDMPQATELPESLKLLARRNALQVNHHAFNPDVYRLIEDSESALNSAEESKIMKVQTLKAAKERIEREATEKVDVVETSDESTFHENEDESVLVTTDFVPLKILVTGGRKVSRPAKETAFFVGYQLILRGHILMSNGANGVDEAAARGALKACQEKSLSPDAWIRVYRPEESPYPNFSFGQAQLVGQRYSQRKDYVVANSDVIIILGGGAGTKKIANRALLLGRPLIPIGIGRPEEAAFSMWQQMLSGLIDSSLEVNDLQKIGHKQEKNIAATSAIIFAENLAANK